MLPRSRADGAALALVAAMAAIGLALVPRLPAEVAVHFTAGGTPDSYLPRLVAVALGPVAALATLAVVRGAARVDPPNDPRSIDAVVVGTTLLLAAVHLLVLGWNLGYRVPIPLVAAGAVLWTLALVGYVVVREGG